MANSKEFDKSTVIQKYLNGKSMNHIATETNISKGKVHYLINYWKDEIRIPNVEEPRWFVVLVKKSGISVGQCAQGYRTLQLMKNLGIEDEEIGNADLVGHTESNKKFSYFVKEIYQNCIKFGIPPSIIPSWIRDLLDCHSYSNSKNSLSLIDEQKEIEKKENYPEKQTPTLKSETDYQLENETSESALDSNFNSNLSNSKNLSPPGLDKKSSTENEIGIPFISQVSTYIAQKKIECVKVANFKVKLKDDIKKLEIQRSKITDRLDRIKQEETTVLSYLRWFYNLEKTF